jgi:hypothetical protein
VIGAFLWAMWSVHPLLLVAALVLAFAFGLFAVGVMDRRPLKPMVNGDISIFPEIIEGRVLETVKPGLGNVYLRAICIFSGIVFLVFGISMVVAVFRNGP